MLPFCQYGLSAICSAITADIQCAFNCASGPACEPVTAMVAAEAEPATADSVVAAGGEVAVVDDSGDFPPVVVVAAVVVPCSPAVSPTGLHTAKAFCKRRKLAGESQY